MLLKDKESYRTVSRLISSDLIMDIVDNFSFFFLSLSTFIYLFIYFFSPPLATSRLVYISLCRSISICFFADPANFLTHVRPCNAESRGAAFYGKAASSVLKVSELATFTRFALKNSRGRNFFGN